MVLGVIARLLAMLAGVTVVSTGAEPGEHDRGFDVLVFSKTSGYRHASIPDGIAAIKGLAARHGFRVDASEDSALFRADTLSRYRVVIFLNTTGDVLDQPQQTAFEAFIRRGGGFVGIHSASDTEYEWPWYGGLVGAYFHSHPEIQPATLRMVAAHLSTRRLPARWQRTDEWYNFRTAPGADITVSLDIDEDSYTGGTMGAHHPMAWHHFYGGGRAWYTALGHTRESYREPLFLDQILGGIEWAAGLEE